jgi:hypothetical protein
MTMNFPKPHGVPLTDGHKPRRPDPADVTIRIASEPGVSKKRMLTWIVFGAVAIYGLTKASSIVLLGIAGGGVALVALGLIVCEWSIDNTIEL